MEGRLGMNDEPVGAGPWGARPMESAGDARAALTQRTAVPVLGLPIPVMFEGTRRAYARLLFASLLLYIPTFGFNRFWLKTDQRRFLWLNTTLNGDSFEYRGTARELVIGFLFAVAIYMPIAAAYSLAGLYAETVRAYASIPFFLFTFAFGHYAAFRARRYRLTRTGYRGIRFWMSGSGWRMGIVAFFWMLLVAITGGIAYPWMLAWLERYKMRHSSYGDLQGSFSGTGWTLLKALLLPLFLILVALGTVFGLIWSYIAITFLAGGFTLVGFALPLSGVLLFCAWSVISVIRTRWWIGGMRFGSVRVTCTPLATTMLWPALRTSVLILLVLAAWIGIGAVLGALAYSNSELKFTDRIFTDVLAIVPAILWITAGLIIVMFIKNVFYNYDFVRKIAVATTIIDLAAIDTVSAKGTAEGAVGEGLADALGADGF